MRSGTSGIPCDSHESSGLVLTLFADASNSVFPSKDQSNSHPIVPSDVPSFLRRKSRSTKQVLGRLTFWRRNASTSTPPSHFTHLAGIVAFLPRFEFKGGGPLEELNWLNVDVDHPAQNSEWRTGTLFWLLRMPLNQREVERLENSTKLPVTATDASLTPSLPGPPHPARP